MEQSKVVQGVATADGVILDSPELQMLRNNKLEGYNYRERRTYDWTENYDLYRDKVQTNRLLQRQSVNLPIMKGQVRTLLKDIDDMPVIYFENLDNDKQAELFKNEYWKYTVEHNNMSIQDIVDKRQVLLFGRSFDQWQIIDGKVVMTVQDPEDILVSRFMNPFDLHSSRYLIHTHIFVPLSSLSQNEDYDQAAVKEMMEFYATRNGLIKSAENTKMMIDKNQKLADMGVPDLESPVLGETYVELTLHFVYRDNEKDSNGKEMPTQIFLYVEVDNMKILMKKPLEEVIGTTKDHFWRNHFPYNTWADDLERQDFWSDAVADMIRTPAKVLNAWFSQLTENRTLRNLNMHYYNSNMEGFNPSTFVPMAWGWYGLPVPMGGNIESVMKTVEVPDLTEAIDEMNFVMQVMEKGTGATAGQQGVASERQITLGEFKATLTEAKDRVKGMSKFYTPVWEQRGIMFDKMLEAAGDRIKAVTLHKKGRNTDKVYSREVSLSDWTTPMGYRVKVWTQEEKDGNDINTLQKQNAVKTAMPNNPKVAEIYNRKLLDWASYSPDEINEIMEWEREQRDLLMQQLQSQMLGGGMPAGQPGSGSAPAPMPTGQQIPPALPMAA